MHVYSTTHRRPGVWKPPGPRVPRSDSSPLTTALLLWSLRRARTLPNRDSSSSHSTLPQSRLISFGTVTLCIACLSYAPRLHSLLCARVLSVHLRPRTRARLAPIPLNDSHSKSQRSSSLAYKTPTTLIAHLDVPRPSLSLASIHTRRRMRCLSGKEKDGLYSCKVCL